jgi:hypothetical protein
MSRIKPPNDPVTAAAIGPYSHSGRAWVSSIT